MKPIVIKYGGAAMKYSVCALKLVTEIARLWKEDITVVMVHGGGPEIERMLSRLNIRTEKVLGLRVTSAETMEVAEMVLSGRVNKGLVGMLQSLGASAAGISGRDGGLFIAKKKEAEGDLGFVGTITETNPHLVETLLGNKFIPVISSIADDGGGVAYNINADEAAAALAIALHAEKLVLLTDVPGVLSAYPDPSSRISRLTCAEAHALIASDAIDKGMLPKLRSCIEVVRRGVASVQIIDGREPSLVREAVLGAGDHGTTIVA